MVVNGADYESDNFCVHKTVVFHSRNKKKNEKENIFQKKI